MQLKKENLLNSTKIINKFNSMLKEKTVISSKKVEREFIKILQYYQFYNNKKNKNINCELNTFFRKKFINGLRFGLEDYTILHIAILNKWHKLVTYLMKNWPIDIELKDKSGNTAWNHACLLLQPKNVLVIKKNNQLSNEDRIFLKESINLLSRKNLFLLKDKEDLFASQNRLEIMKQYDNSVDEIVIDTLEYFKTEINLELTYNKIAPTTSTINNNQTL